MNATCRACGGKCCRTMIFTNPPWQAMDFLLKTRAKKADAKHIIVASRCRHLSKDGTCRIYADRPAECVNYQVDGQECRMTRSTWA